MSVSEYLGVGPFIESLSVLSWRLQMGEWIERALRNPKARVTGAVYLFYFLTAIPAQFLLGGRLAAYGNATNLIATAFYVILTLLFYGIFRPVSRILSLIAALFSLAGCFV